MHNSTKNYVKREITKLFTQFDVTVEKLMDQCDISIDDINEVINEMNSKV